MPFNLCVMSCWFIFTIVQIGPIVSSDNPSKYVQSNMVLVAVVSTQPNLKQQLHAAILLVRGEAFSSLSNAWHLLNHEAGISSRLSTARSRLFFLRLVYPVLGAACVVNTVFFRFKQQFGQFGRKLVVTRVTRLWCHCFEPPIFEPFEGGLGQFCSASQLSNLCSRFHDPECPTVLFPLFRDEMVIKFVDISDHRFSRHEMCHSLVQCGSGSFVSRY